MTFGRNGNLEECNIILYWSPMAILSENGIIINMMPFQSLLAGCISIQNIIMWNILHADN